MPYYNETRVGGAMDADHIYYNINISNDYSGFKSNGQGQSTANTEQQLTFNQTRAQPYLINPSEYYMSIQRLTIETPWLPVLLVQPIVGQANVTKTIYSFTIVQSGTGTTTTVNVPWVNTSPSYLRYSNAVQNKYLTAPSGPVTSSYYTNPYYYCYSYNFFLDQLNNAIQTVLVSTYGLTNRESHVGISFNPVTGLFTIMAPYILFRTDSNGTAIGTGANKYNIYFNTELYNLFSSLPAVYCANTVSNGLDYKMLFTTGDSAVPAGYVVDVSSNVLHPNYNYIYKTQDYSSLPLWSPIKSIVVRASLLNVVAENVATPVVFENGNQNINAGKQNTNILPILVEYSVPLNFGTEYRPYIFYQPTGEYRLSDLYSDIPVSSLQFDVFWKDTFGNLIPLQLAMGASATMKILFRKKIFNSDQV